MAWGVVLIATSCASPRGGWDRAAFEAEHPALAKIKRQRLYDTPPYYIPDRDSLVLFLCRWSGEEEIPVALPDDASEGELISLRAALAGWQNAGLGIRFREVPRLQSAHGIEVRLFAAEDETFALGREGDTIADCRIGTGAAAGEAGNPVPARLQWASIFLRRANLDSLDRSVPLSRAQLAGQALHELGHALGFSGHVAALRGIMTRNNEVALRFGEGLLEAKPFSDPHLSALYTVPSGSIVGRLQAKPERLAPLLRFVAIARDSSRWSGPFVQVGDRDVRIFWKQAAGASAIFQTRDWIHVVQGQEDFGVRLGAVARSALSAER